FSGALPPSFPTRRSSDLEPGRVAGERRAARSTGRVAVAVGPAGGGRPGPMGDDVDWNPRNSMEESTCFRFWPSFRMLQRRWMWRDRKSTRLNSSHVKISY